MAERKREAVALPEKTRRANEACGESMKRSKKTHKGFSEELVIFDSQRLARYFLEALLWGTAFALALVVEASYTTARVAVSG
jgi:hypothetical protein